MRTDPLYLLVYLIVFLVVIAVLFRFVLPLLGA